MKKYMAVILFACAALTLLVRDLPDVIAASAVLQTESRLILIDPGHGGEDGGAVGVNGVCEKVINLDIAIILGELFRSSGYDVILTRDGDYSLGDTDLAKVSDRKVSDMKKREDICNTSGATVLLSIHQNYFTEEQYSGAQVFFGAAEDSMVLAESIQLRLREDVQPENRREIKPGGESSYLLNNSIIPSVIVECGFISNSEEADKLTDPEYQKRIAYSIYLGTTDYLRQH